MKASPTLDLELEVESMTPAAPAQALTQAPAPAPVAIQAAPQSEAGAMLAMIERAARDPGVDIDKMERLMAMRDRMTADTARRAYDMAFAEMQPEMPEIDKRGQIIIKEKGGEKIIQSTPYALWEDTNRAIKPILNKHGFGLSFRISQTPDRLTTTAVLSHRDGHREETSFSAPIDNSGSKNNVQGWGSSFSYGKRYTGTAILNISTRGEDDDGKKAGAPETIESEQVAELQRLIVAYGVDKAKFLEFCKVESLMEIAVKDYPTRLSALKQKAPKQ